MRTKIDGIYINYELTGRGKTFVLTHGLGGELGNWGHVVPPFAELYQVLTWDVRGFGRSDKPDGEFSPGLFAQDLHQLLVKLNIAGVYLLGHSMGGVIAQRFALDYPDQVEALILVATSSEVAPKFMAGWQERIRLVQEKGMEGVVPFSNRGYGPEFATTHPQMVKERSKLLLNNDPKAYVKATGAISDYNYTGELPRLKCPTLILQGDKDVITPPGGSVIMSRNIPGSELKIYKGCGHMVPTEREREFVGDILDFLKRVEMRGQD
ncbi:MAG: alpha/beta fold hydrolase [Dehalococcoidia bacterium]